MPAPGPDTGKSPNIDLVRSCAELLADVRAIRGGLERQADRLHRVEQELKIMVAALRGRALGLYSLEGSLELRPVAHVLTTFHRADDSLEFQIDGGKRFALPPRLEALLLFLAEQTSAGEDGLASWKSRNQIAAWWQTKTGSGVRRQYVNNMIWSLKEALRKAGISSRLIQSHPHKGVRFALKRHASGDPW